MSAALAFELPTALEAVEPPAVRDGVRLLVAHRSDGGGRSEMSSPGNASWCMRVRMSPGSTA